MDWLKHLFSSGDFRPHGYCYLWDSNLVALHVTSDVLIALAYFSIPITIVYFVRKRRDLPFDWMFMCFGVFIVACGSTHVMEVWTLWHATYWLSGIVKAVTAIASVPTAILLVQLVPKALALPSPEALRQVNRELIERTEELSRANSELGAVNQALRQSEDRYRLLFDSNPHPVWVFDVETLRFLDVNHSAVQTYGYSREEFLFRTIKDIRPPEEIPALMESLKTMQLSEASGIWRHRKKDGTLVAVEIHSHYIALDGRNARLVVATDVTQRTKSEEALQASERKFRTLLESAPDAMVIVNLDSRIELVNAQTEKLFGYTRSELLGKCADILVPERFRSNHSGLHTEFFHAPEARQMSASREVCGLHKDGTEFPIEISLRPLETKEGMLVSSAIRDISDRKKAEQALEQQRNELAQSNAELTSTNKELEAFSYSVSHDLRAPLRSIDGFSLALLEDYSGKLDAEGKDSLKRVRAATQRMGVLIDDLLGLARVTRTETKFEGVDLSEVGRSVAAALQKAEPGRYAEFQIEAELKANADPRLIRIALENLLGNAWKFTSKSNSARIEFGRAHQNGTSTFFIRDNGAGFDSANATRLFGAFQRLHDSSEFPGTGVGLATVQRIIHRHGGTIWAEGAVDKGATFYFTLWEAGHGGA